LLVGLWCVEGQHTSPGGALSTKEDSAASLDMAEYEDSRVLGADCNCGAGGRGCREAETGTGSLGEGSDGAVRVFVASTTAKGFTLYATLTNSS
jgi:hypothetical protein